MADSPVREIKFRNTLGQARSEVTESFGNLQSVNTGDRLILVDGERYIQVDIDRFEPTGNVSEDAITGSIRFCFVGYTESEADELLDQYTAHSHSLNSSKTEK